MPKRMEKIIIKKSVIWLKDDSGHFDVYVQPVTHSLNRSSNREKISRNTRVCTYVPVHKLSHNKIKMTITKSLSVILIRQVYFHAMAGTKRARAAKFKIILDMVTAC